MKKLFILLAVISSTYSIIFQCEYPNAYYGNLGDIIHCNVTSYSDEGNHVLTAVNKSGWRESNLKVKVAKFNLFGKNLDYIPKGLEKFFPNMIAIGVFGGKISKLSGDELNAYENLVSFHLCNTLLEYVPGNLFSNNLRISYIFLNDNKIKYVGSSLLNGLNMLVRVGFARNICIDQSALFSNAEIVALKKNLLEKCAVNEGYLKTTTTTPNPATTTQNPHEKEIQRLRAQILNFEQDKAEVLKIEQENSQLKDKISTLEEENKKYLDKIENEDRKLNVIKNELKNLIEAKLSSFETRFSSNLDSIKKSEEKCNLTSLDTKLDGIKSTISDGFDDMSKRVETMRIFFGIMIEDSCKRE